MAKRVTTTIGQSDFWDKDDLVTLNQKRKKHTGRNIGIIVFIVVLLLVGLITMMMISYTGIQRTAQQQMKIVDNSNTQTTPAVTQPPIDLSFSGSGTSSTNEFALPEGNYLVSYSFSTTDPNSISSSDITCVNYLDTQEIPNVITGSGSGSDFRSINPSTKCTYDVTASSGVQWTVKIVKS